MSDPTAPIDGGAASRLDLLRRLVAEGKLAFADLPIPPRPAGVTQLPLSFGQEELWVLDCIEPGGITFNLAIPPLRLDGELDRPALERALQALVRRHEILRTTFHGRGGDPVQVVYAGGATNLECEERQGIAEEAREGVVREAMQREMERPFDLELGPLFRARLLKFDDRAHVLLLTMHHMVFDGASMGIVLSDLGRLYTASSAGEDSPLPPLAIQYADFALAQRRWLKGAAFDRHLDYWRERLRGVVELRLPLEHPRPAARAARTMRDSAVLSPALSDALRALGRREGATPFTLLLAVFATLLQRYAQQDDIAVGTAVTTRTRREVESVVGFFVNMVVLRTDFSGRPSFRDLLARAREATLGAMQHALVPFDQVVRALGVARRPGRNPLFQVSFAFEADAAATLRFGALQSRLMRFHSDGGSSGGAIESAIARYDVEAYARDENGCLSLELAVTQAFGREALRQMLSAFRQLAIAVVADPDRPVAELPLLSEDDRSLIVGEWNRSAAPYPREPGTHELFARWARDMPEAPAVEYGPDRLSYAELAARAGRLAAQLRARGVGPEVTVGLALPRAPKMIVAMLGILEAGGAYVPLDPEYPAERLTFMLADSAARVVVTDAATAPRLPGLCATLVLLDQDGEAVDPVAPLALPSPPRITGEHLAYLIYTSGSTGVPKGVQVPQRAIARLVCGTDYLQLRAGQRVAQVSVVSFDAATFEVWGALLNGGTVVIVPREISIAPDEFGAYLSTARIDALFLTTALFNQLARLSPTVFAPVGCVLFGGEACDPDAVRRVLKAGPPRRLLHVYGPTEVTTFATAHEVLEVEDGAATIPIGRPIANTTAYVVDDTGEPVPVGVAGELLLGGDGVARGYLNRPELSTKSFVPDRFGPDPQARLYRTGDIVRRRGDGAIEFVGRRDNQVKIRGFRIELGEIESALRLSAPLRDAVVVVREDAPGDRRVVAYVVPEAGADAGADKLRAALRARLPEHLVPSAFISLEALPLNANGKIDRAALPPPHAETAAAGGATPQPTAAEPTSDLERRIAALWQEVLQVPQIGIRDNFFDLGGHSLLLVRTHAKLRDELGLDCKVVDLFTYPTVESLAAHLGQGASAAAGAAPAAARPGAEAGSQPIAIIGMAGRFPGAGSVEAFWDNLCAGRESIRFFSSEEMRASGVPESLIADPDHVPARGYLEGADLFDAGYFGYSAREAEAIDPQQRLLLECAVELLDRAGVDPQRCAGAIGVYAGASLNSYLPHLMSRQALPESLSGLSRVLASGQDFLATRLSYKLDLRGPSLNVQSACSTSLVAVHQACRALQNHECDLAMAGGVSVSVPLMAGHVYVDEGIGSRDGHCRAFDAAASGTVGGNGVALVLLKRLDEALRDDDHVHAVIRGIAINNDGSAKVGYTAPSVEGQARAIAMAQAAAGLRADDVQVIEAHGTGTHLGDPIEIAALTRVFGYRPRATDPCWIGALKSNVGHLDAAAGVAGLIKLALAIEHGRIPPSLHYESPNPQIDFARSPFAVNSRLRDWIAADGAPRRGGVSSFGLGGTNAHAVLEQAPAAETGTPPSSRPWQLLCLSARTPSALTQAARDLADRLRRPDAPELADAAWTLQTGRREHAHRRTVVACTQVEAAALLEAAPGERSPVAVAPAAGNRPVVFMFSGQGSQYPGMGAGLYRSEPVFRETVDRCCDTLAEGLGLDLRALLFPTADRMAAAAERLRQTQLTQPALFTIALATAHWWMSIGVRPSALLGHSIGELVAAHLAGVMSLDDALTVVTQRGRLMGERPPGAMLSVALSEAQLRPHLSDEVSFAALNGPELSVLSGPEAAIDALEARLAALGGAPRRLHTSHAFHSGMMDAALPPFLRCLQGVPLRPPTLPLLSNVSGDWLTPEQATDPHYWARQLREPVRFSPALERLFGDDTRLLLEAGPGNTLASLARSHPLRPAGVACVASMRHPGESRDDVAALLEAVGRLWAQGVRPDWAALHGTDRRRRVVLPTTPLERRRYWIDAPSQAPSAPATPTPARPSADPGDWLYLPSWRQLPPPAETAPWRTADWLLLDDPRGLARALEARLRESGARVARLRSAPAYAERGDDGFEADLQRPDQLQRVLNALATRGRRPAVVVDLRASGATADGESSFFALVALVQSLAATGAPMRLAVVAGRALDGPTGDVPDPDRAMLLAPCKVLSMEHPPLGARFIDIDATESADTLARVLAADLCAVWRDPVVAWRGRRRWVQTYEPVPTARPGQRLAALKDGATVAITGGLGGVGLTVAEHLAQRARVGLVLIGRSALPPREAWPGWVATHGDADPVTQRIRRVEAIEALGAAVLVCQADVAAESQLTAALAIAQARFGPISGLIHAAGAPKTGQTLAELTTEACHEQWRPRRDGLLALQRVLQGRPLEFVLVHSSLASVLGVAGFVSYTAAHLWMDAFVLARSAEGPTQWRAIDWDHWAEAGSGPANRVPGSAADSAMPAAGACEALERALSLPDEPLLVVSASPLQARLERWQRSEHAVDDHGPDTAGAEVATAAGHPRPALSTDYVMPRTPAEQMLAAIWQQVLGIDRIGVNDSFFELGGDSVLNIQITSKARQAGLPLSPKLVFEHQTIAELAAALAGAPTVPPGPRPAADDEVDAARAPGPLPLTPIQAWFLGRGLPRPDHFNLSLLLQLREPIEAARLARSLERLMAQHEALRLRWRRDGGTWICQLLASAPVPPVEVYDLSALDADAQNARIDEIGHALQASLDLAEGPTWRVARFDLGGTRPPHLAFVMHHLAVDMIGWRILLEDLQTLVEADLAGTPPERLARTVALRPWAEALHREAAGPARDELPYWRGLAARPALPLPRDRDRGPNDVASTALWEEVLDADTTRSLLLELPRHHDAHIADALLMSLAHAIRAWRGGDTLLVDVEGHGRDQMGLDDSRTVGWFTTLYPMRIDLRRGADASEDLTAVAAQRRALPRDGFGFGLLRHLSPDDAVRAEMAALPQPEISFLYLGQLDQAFSPSALFVPTLLPCGAFHDPSSERAHLIELNAFITRGSLRLGWHYSRHLHDEATIRRLAAAQMEALRRLLGGPAMPEGPAIGPSAADLAEIARQLSAGSRVSG